MYSMKRYGIGGMTAGRNWNNSETPGGAGNRLEQAGNSLEQAGKDWNNLKKAETLRNQLEQAGKPWNSLFQLDPACSKLCLHI